MLIVFNSVLSMYEINDIQNGIRGPQNIMYKGKPVTMTTVKRVTPLRI